MTVSGKPENIDTYDQIKREIKRGLVLRLDPTKLTGATCSSKREYQVEGWHYFACIGTGLTNEVSFWIPVFTNSGYHRAYVAPDWKWGCKILGKWNNLHVAGSGLGGEANDDFLLGIDGKRKERQCKAELH